MYSNILLMAGTRFSSRVFNGLQYPHRMPWRLGTGDSTFHCYPLGCQFETRCGRVLKGHTVCGVAGQECGFAHVAGLVDGMAPHVCRIYLRSFAGKHTLYSATNLRQLP